MEINLKYKNYKEYLAKIEDDVEPYIKQYVSKVIDLPDYSNGRSYKVEYMYFKSPLYIHNNLVIINYYIEFMFKDYNDGMPFISANDEFIPAHAFCYYLKNCKELSGNIDLEPHYKFEVSFEEDVNLIPIRLEDNGGIDDGFASKEYYLEVLRNEIEKVEKW